MSKQVRIPNSETEITMYWSKYLKRWVTIPEGDKHE